MKTEDKKASLPQMPKPSAAAASDRKSAPSPLAPGLPSVEGEGLDVPTHDEDMTGANGLSKHADAMLNPEKRAEDDDAFAKPGYESATGNQKSHVKASPARKVGIEVVALRKGFYNQQRYETGDAFTIRNEEELGEWMKCKDESQEKKRVEMFRKKKMSARNRNNEGDEE